MPAAACRSGGGRFGNSLPRCNCGRTPSLAICVLEVYPVTDRQPIAGFSTMQNIGRGSYTLTRVHGWRMLPATRFPGDLSHGRAPQPHEKTAAATGVLQDRPQSAAGRKHPGKVKIISLTSTLWRRAEHRPVRLMEPFSFHQTHRHRSSGSCRRAGVADEFHFPPVTQAPSGRLACDTQSRSQSQFPPGIPTVRQYTRSVSEIRAADRATEPAASGEACRPRQ